MGMIPLNMLTLPYSKDTLYQSWFQTQVSALLLLMLFPSQNIQVRALELVCHLYMHSSSRSDSEMNV